MTLVVTSATMGLLKWDLLQAICLRFVAQFAAGEMAATSPNCHSRLNRQGLVCGAVD